MDFTFWDILRNLLLATRWTITLSIAGFVCGGAGGLLLMIFRISHRPAIRNSARLYIELFQGTPLLLQLFLVFFGLPLIGLNVRPWLAAGVGLTLSASAYLAEIWRGCVEALPAGQWDAAAALGLHRRYQLQLVILPQALRIAVPPTVGFLVQLVKSTALTSIIGFDELLRTGTVITNATFAPFTVYGVVALIYFAVCFPLTLLARRLELRLSRPGA
jgi:polar amino acid transport system permease protein